MTLRNLSGIVTATPTPVLDGEVDEKSARELAGYLVSQGAAGIAPIGGTGEYISLSEKQKLQMVEYTAGAVGGAIPVIAGLIAPGLGEVKSMGRAILSAGADGLLVTTPFYARPTQEGVVDYFKAISDILDTDIVLYEFPYRTGVSLTAETIVRLAETTRIVAMKACNADTGLQMRVIEAAGDKISILSGDEDVYPLHIAAGARGGLLASSCVVPQVWNRIDSLARQNRVGEAVELHARIRPLLKALFTEHNPGPLKAALTAIGRPAGEPLSPLLSANAATRTMLAEVLPVALELEKSMTA